ncbi:hypothetical protein ACFL1M_03530 [Patescibacteria group bacterium]
MNKEKIQPLSKEILGPKASTAWAWALWQGVRARLRPEISDQDLENIRLANEALTETSIIAIGYHPGKIEAVIMPIFIRRYFTKLNRLIGPIAAYQYHQTIPRVWAGVSSSTLRTHFLPVVRENNPKDAHLLEHQRPYRKRLFYHTKENILKQPSNMYGVVPGGTRDEMLPPPSEVNTSFVRMNRDESALYVPMAFVKDGNQNKIRVGPPSSLSDIPEAGSSRAEVALHQATWLMNQLALLLPEENRGTYPILIN